MNSSLARRADGRPWRCDARPSGKNRRGDGGRHSRRRRPGRRPVDDQHRHRRRRGHGASDRGPCPRGLRLVRLTVNRDEAAAAVPRIRERLVAMGVNVPLIGDFHYIGHKLLADHPACAEALNKYRINPGNVGFRAKRDLQFGQIVEIAIRNGKTVRIGANWGSLDQELLTHLMDENAATRPARHALGYSRGDGPIRASFGGASRGDRTSRARGSFCRRRFRRSRI